MWPTSETSLCCGQIDARHLLDRGAQRAAGAERDDESARRRGASARGTTPRPPAMPSDELSGGGIGRHHLAIGQLEALGQPRRKLHAGGDRVIEAEGDQPLGERQRDQPLRGRARDVELAGDLVLGIAGDEIEPAGARRVVETRFFRIRVIARPACGRNSAMMSKMRSAPAAASSSAPLAAARSGCRR